MQLCFSVAAEALLRDAHVLYLDTNGSFCPRRLKQIVVEKCKVKVRGPSLT